MFPLFLISILMHLRILLFSAILNVPMFFQSKLDTWVNTYLLIAVFGIIMRSSQISVVISRRSACKSEVVRDKNIKI